MRQHLGAWRQIGAPPHVLRWLREGVRIEWADGPPPPFHHGVSRVLPQDREWISAERDRCLLTGAWTRATCFDYVSRAFVVTHNGKRRLVFNLKHVNEFCRKQGVHFGSLTVLRRMMRHGDYMWSIDLSDAYHHVGVHPSDQKYFTFAVTTDQGIEYFSTSALNFGWTRSPQIFTEVMRPVVAFLRNPAMAGRHREAMAKRLGVVLSSPTEAGARPLRTLPWLDDFAFFDQCSSIDEARSRRDYSYSVFDALGVTRNAAKGQSEPSHRLDDHLGFSIDSLAGTFGVTTRRERKLRFGALTILREAARRGRTVPARALASFAGLAQSTSLAIALVRCWLRAPYDDLTAMSSWRGRVRLSRQSLSDIRQFTTLRGSSRAQRSIWLRADTAVGYVDAGPLGWGGVLSRPARLPVAGFWTAAEASIHITFRELRAVRLLILHYLQELTGRRLLLYEDNQAVVAILASLVSRSPELMAELRLLLELIASHDISLRALYIRSAENVVADRQSRLARHREYAIQQHVFHMLTSLWGACSVDGFASAATAQLQRFWTEQPTPEAEAVDAFAQDWASEHVWAHPPPHLLPQLAQFLRERPAASATVCVPHWPGAVWFGDLLELSVAQATFPPGSLRRVAFDAPSRLEQWPVTAFLVLPRDPPAHLDTG